MEGAGIEEGMLGRREAESPCIEAGGGEVERKLDMHMKVGTVIDSGSQATDFWMMPNAIRFAPAFPLTPQYGRRRAIIH